MTDFIKVSKTQADDLLRNTGRTYYQLHVKQDVGETRLPTLYCSLSGEEVHEIVDASTERRYGNEKCYAGNNTYTFKARLEVKVGKVWYRLNLDGTL